jgi:uncharacterized delta-60 repeat protein
VAAERHDSSEQTGLLLARLTAAGRLDTSFGSGGFLTADASGVSGVLVQADNRVIVWGSWPLPYLRRYRANGTLDSAWTPQLPNGATVVSIGTLASNGDLIVGSAVGSATTFYRYTPNGTLDGTFTSSFVFPGTNPATSSSFAPTDLVELPGGKFLVVGTLLISSPILGGRVFIGAVQLTSTGQVDTTFGTAGYIATQSNGYPSVAVATVDALGRLLVVRGSGEESFSGYLTVTRYTTAGVPDASFGVNGSATGEVDGYAIATGISVRGNWIVVGILTFTYPENMATVRFRTDTTKLGAGYTVDSNGVLTPFRFGTDPPPPCVESPNLRGLARGVTTVTNRGGLILDGYGGLHPFSAGARKAPAPARAGPYWPGFDIARGVTAFRNGTGGYVLDGYGGIHRYRTGSNPMPATTTGAPYWPGWDIARGIALLPNGTGGYVLDGFGVLHRFRVGANPLPPATTVSLNLPGVDVARGVSILSNGTGGYVVDVFGNLHPFGIGSHAAPPLPGATTPNGRTPNARGVTFVEPRLGP